MLSLAPISKGNIKLRYAAPLLYCRAVPFQIAFFFSFFSLWAVPVRAGCVGFFVLFFWFLWCRLFLFCLFLRWLRLPVLVSVVRVLLSRPLLFGLPLLGLFLSVFLCAAAVSVACALLRALPLVVCPCSGLPRSVAALGLLCAVLLPLWVLWPRLPLLCGCPSPAGRVLRVCFLPLFPLAASLVLVPVPGLPLLWLLVLVFAVLCGFLLVCFPQRGGRSLLWAVGGFFALRLPQRIKSGAFSGAIGCALDAYPDG